MKKTLIIIHVLTLLFGISNVKAQTTPIQIEGTTFYVNCNKQTMTAEICDNDYRIDDREFPIYMQTRRINGLPKIGLNKLNIPETVIVDGQKYTITSIGRAAFAGYKNFFYVNIPNSVTNIGEYAFYRTQLMSVNIPASVSNIAKRAFGYCSLLQKINLPNKRVAIADNIYDGDVTVTTDDTEDTEDMPHTQVTISTPSTADVDINIPTSSMVNDQIFAVIIANEDYQKEAKAEYAINDGRVFKKYCRTTLGIPEKNIHIIENATLDKMHSEINWLQHVAAVYEGEARIIVYYAGHGMPDKNMGSAYLLPVDGSSNNIQTGYSLNTLYAELSNMGTQSVTLFIDACFCGAQRGEGTLSANYDAPIATREEHPKGNLVVFSATQKDEAALIDEELKHGIFTYYLLKKLQDSKGEASYQEIATYLRKEVGRYAIVVNNIQQTPTMRASETMSNKLGSMKLK